MQDAVGCGLRGEAWRGKQWGLVAGRMQPARRSVGSLRPPRRRAGGAGVQSRMRCTVGSSWRCSCASGVGWPWAARLGLGEAGSPRARTQVNEAGYESVSDVASPEKELRAIHTEGRRAGAVRLRASEGGVAVGRADRAGAHVRDSSGLRTPGGGARGVGAEPRTGEMTRVGWLWVIASDGVEVPSLRCGGRTGGGRAPLGGGAGASHRCAHGRGGAHPAISQVNARPGRLDALADVAVRERAVGRSHRVRYGTVGRASCPACCR